MDPKIIKINNSDLEKLKQFYTYFEPGKDGKDVRIPTNPKDSLTLFSSVRAALTFDRAT